MPRDDRTKEAFEMIEQGVRDVFSSDNFKQYLSFLSKFHTYSLNNMILIMSQYPEATLVAGYNTWSKSFNRHVNKGEKGIKILAPYEVKSKVLVDKKDADGNVMLDSNGNVEQEEKERKTISFMIVNVFDVAQTSGEPLPELDTRELTGSSKEITALIDSIREVCEIPIEMKETGADSVLQNGAKGYYNKLKDMIVVSADMDDKQVVKTLAHEYAHSLLHKQTEKPQFQREVEAESLAFVICDHFGIDTSDYSFTYVAAYASENPDKLKEILLNIHSEAHEIIEKIEPVFQEKLRSEPVTEIHLPDGLAKANYEKLEKLAKPILEGEASYMKLSSPAMMDLHIEKVLEDKLVLAHYFKENGDLVPDPRMEVIFDPEDRFVMADTYEQFALGYFQSANDSEMSAEEMNRFLGEWLTHADKCQYRIREVHAGDMVYTSQDTPKELKQFCSNYGMARMVEKKKEVEAR